MMLHATYESSTHYGFRQADFFSFFLGGLPCGNQISSLNSNLWYVLKVHHQRVISGRFQRIRFFK